MSTRIIVCRKSIVGDEQDINIPRFYIRKNSMSICTMIKFDRKNTRCYKTTNLIRPIAQNRYWAYDQCATLCGVFRWIHWDWRLGISIRNNWNIVLHTFRGSKQNQSNSLYALSQTHFIAKDRTSNGSWRLNLGRLCDFAQMHGLALFLDFLIEWSRSGIRFLLDQPLDALYLIVHQGNANQATWHGNFRKIFCLLLQVFVEHLVQCSLLCVPIQFPLYHRHGRSWNSGLGRCGGTEFWRQSKLIVAP
mmetsp:Transcript_45123/g.94646  ORF Transcript_45123/g.94646 Transcript_45123/m.94646 type:complete len:248 (-) Transcript_45123:595-1338(-)